MAGRLRNHTHANKTLTPYGINALYNVWVYDDDFGNNTDRKTYNPATLRKAALIRVCLVA
jgi:hypothetical protein